MATGIPKSHWTSPSPDARAHLDSRLERAGNNRSLTTVYAPAGTTPSGQLYYGDNAHILATLQSDPQVRRRVSLVYIDPPYGTNSIFQTRRLESSYSDVLTGQDYIEHLRTRLLLLRELMTPSASIYVHIDDRMLFAVKALMDQVFGESNFRNLITRRKCSSKNYTRKSFGNVADYLLFYTISDLYTWNRPHATWSSEHAEREYPYVDELTGRRYKRVPVHAPGVRNGETGKPWRGMVPPVGRHWKCAPRELDALDARGEIYWSATGNPRKKVFLDQSAGVPLTNIWMDFRDTHNQNVATTGYPTEKCPKMLATIIEASSSPGDLVLDCYAGSGTTLAAARHLGRNWIGIDNSPQALRACLQRLLVGPTTLTRHLTSRRRRLESGDLFSGSPLQMLDFGIHAECSLAGIASREIGLHFAIPPGQPERSTETERLSLATLSKTRTRTSRKH